MRTIPSLSANALLRLGRNLIPALALCAASQAALAADRAALGDQISGRINMSADERLALEPVLAHYYALDGNAGTLQSVLEIFANTGCREDCMADLVGLVNKLMKSGVPCSLAGREVALTVMSVKTRSSERGIAPTPTELSRATRSIIEGKYREAPGALPNTPSATLAAPVAPKP